MQLDILILFENEFPFVSAAGTTASDAPPAYQEKDPGAVSKEFT